MDEQTEKAVVEVIYTYVVSQLAQGIVKEGSPYAATLSLDGFFNWKKWMLDHNVCLVVYRDEEKFTIRLEQINIEKLQDVKEKENEHEI